jgi:DnaK suppressor protein
MPRSKIAKERENQKEKNREDDKKARKEFLKKANETLLDMKKQLLREIRDRLKEETQAIKDEGRDTYDLASDERDREINFILSDREREKLVAIDEALQRLKDHAYGVCECGCDNCEGEIGLGRLRVLPFTRLCVRCQEHTERESKMQRRFDEERGYRKLAITDIEDENT